jgi:hypothetical protein
MLEVLKKEFDKIRRNSGRSLSILALSGRLLSFQPSLEADFECPKEPGQPIAMNISFSGGDPEMALAIGVLNTTTGQEGIVAGGNEKIGYHSLMTREPRGLYRTGTGRVDIQNGHEFLIRGYQTPQGQEKSTEVARQNLVINCP